MRKETIKYLHYRILEIRDEIRQLENEHMDSAGRIWTEPEHSRYDELTRIENDLEIMICHKEEDCQELYRLRKENKNG